MPLINDGASNAPQDETYVDQVPFNNDGGSDQVPLINDGASNAPSKNKESDLTFSKAPRSHKSVGGKGLFLLGAASGSGSGNDSDSGDDDSSVTATISNDVEEENVEDYKKTSENEDVGDDAEEDDSDYTENANAELDNTTKVTSKVTTRAHKIKITTNRKLVEEPEPDSVAATRVEDDETTEQESPVKKKKRKFSPQQDSNKKPSSKSPIKKARQNLLQKLSHLTIRPRRRFMEIENEKLIRIQPKKKTDCRNQNSRQKNNCEKHSLLASIMRSIDGNNGLMSLQTHWNWIFFLRNQIISSIKKFPPMYKLK